MFTFFYSKYYHSFSAESSGVLQQSRVLRSRDFCDRRCEPSSPRLPSSFHSPETQPNVSSHFLMPIVWTWCSRSKFSRKMRYRGARDENARSRNVRLDPQPSAHRSLSRALKALAWPHGALSTSSILFQWLSYYCQDRFLATFPLHDPHPKRVCDRQISDFDLQPKFKQR